jgi:hypothetical protein
LAEHIKPRRVLIVENLINFLTLPKIPDGIGVFGGGFAVHLLREVQWLNQCDVIYWGDIDAHGFEILSDLRGLFPLVRSLMMDQETLETYANYVVQGARSRLERFGHLTESEALVVQVVIENDWRLEQEHIPQDYVELRLKQATPRIHRTAETRRFTPGRFQCMLSYYQYGTSKKADRH